MSLITATAVAALTLFLYAAWTDVRTMRIPNWVSLALIALWVVRVALAPASSAAGDLWLHDLGLFAAVFASLFLLWGFGLSGGIGAGDVKIISAGVLWFGYDPSCFWFFAVMGLVGGVIGLAVLLFRVIDKRLMYWAPQLYIPFKRLTFFLVPAFFRNNGFPYGPAIAAGAVFATWIQLAVWLDLGSLAILRGWGVL